MGFGESAVMEDEYYDDLAERKRKKKREILRKALMERSRADGNRGWLGDSGSGGGIYSLDAGVSLPVGVTNYGATLLPHWKSVKSQFLAGTYAPVIGCSGDSETEGTGSNNTALGLRSAAYPDRIAALLTAAGLLAEADSTLGNGAPVSIAEQQTYDPKISGSAGWVFNGNQTLGGNIIEAGTGVTTSRSYLPSFAWDTIELRVFDASGSATFAWSINGGALTNISPTGTSGYKKITIPTGAAPAIQTLNIQRISGGSLYSCEVHCYNSVARRVAVKNFGRASWKVGNGIAAASQFSPLNAIRDQACDINIFAYGINNWNDGTDVLASFKTDYQTLIDNAKAAGSGDTVLVIPPASDDTLFATLARQQTYWTAIRELAQTNGCLLIDWNLILGGSFAVSYAAGNMYDTRHSNGVGKNKMAQAAVSTLLKAWG